jgi:transcriptional regulator with XRE-family HTH domain
MKPEKDVSKVFLTQIGENIKKKRKKKDLSLEELGLEMGLTRMQVHRIEKGYNITATTILKLSMALGVAPSEIVKFDYKFKKEDLEKLVNNNKASKKKPETKKAK